MCGSASEAKGESGTSLEPRPNSVFDQPTKKKPRACHLPERLAQALQTERKVQGASSLLAALSSCFAEALPAVGLEAILAAPGAAFLGALFALSKLSSSRRCQTCPTCAGSRQTLTASFPLDLALQSAAARLLPRWEAGRGSSRAVDLSQDGAILLVEVLLVQAHGAHSPAAWRRERRAKGRRPAPK
eukprot:CAMPEP_0175214170 /NCGR_PEP_ID=MMETSP0093-20121207/16566_1 /TAXON_ID=311494 /ORGANISM="Alexandrium monilatum, Strain CCMP3105" /LENGTH=186 /DNA_ID=CAMNT_0016507509 /DNA_START=131 /DNA_END=690 /DNA_ORIENTATION=+